VRVWACCAAGVGLRATARGCAVDPHPVWQVLGEAAAQLQAFPRSVLCAVHGTPLQRAEWYAVIRALTDGPSRADNAIQRLAPSRPWVWTAIEPVRTWLLVLEVGPRTLAMAQRVGHPGAPRCASPCRPLWLSAGLKGALPAILGHCGVWHQPERKRAHGPVPQPRGRPLPGRLDAQVSKQDRRRRGVRGQHRVVVGPLEAVAHVLAACGWTIPTSLIARLHRDSRPRVAAVGRRGHTRCQGEDGVPHPRALCHVYYPCVLAPASVRQPLQGPESPNGRGAATVGRPWPPAMAAGVTAHVWTRQAVRLLRVPPWPQPHTVSSVAKRA